jgi:hypothetical protein
MNAREDSIMASCERCNGKGRIPDFLGGRLGGERCGDCGGTGRVPGSAQSALTGGQKRDTYLVSLGRHRTVEETVAAGCYDWVNDDVNTVNFPEPPPRRGDVWLELIHLNALLTTAEVGDRLFALGLVPAGLWHLLALGEEYPEIQRKIPVVALGSSWVDPYRGHRVPLLYGSAGDRSLSLDWAIPDSKWDISYQFLIVRK